MLVQLAKWGNSLAIRIPAAYAKAIGAMEHGKADLSIEDGKLVLKPLPQEVEFDLETLIGEITYENRHEEISAGAALGAEFA